jgi:hypothetical protein
MYCGLISRNVTQKTCFTPASTSVRTMTSMLRSNLAGSQYG